MTKKERPTIKLSPLEKTVVHTPTQEEYDTLMQIYECGGWRWVASGREPTKGNRWTLYQKNTSIDMGISFNEHMEEKFGFSPLSYYKSHNAEIISLKEFYKIQGITDSKLKEIKKYFEGEND